MERVDVSTFLFFENFIDYEEDAALLHIAEFVVDSCAEHTHCGREAHIGVHKRRNCLSVGTHLTVEDEEIAAVILPAEDIGEYCGVGTNLERPDRTDEVIGVGEVLVEKVKYHVAARFRVAGVHGYFAEEILDIWIYHSQ